MGSTVVAGPRTWRTGWRAAESLGHLGSWQSVGFSKHLVIMEALCNCSGIEAANLDEWTPSIQESQYMSGNLSQRLELTLLNKDLEIST